LDPNIAFLSSSMNNMLVCGILKGLNETLDRKKPYPMLEGNVNEIDIVAFRGFEVLDPELF